MALSMSMPRMKATKPKNWVKTMMEAMVPSNPPPPAWLYLAVKMLAGAEEAMPKVFMETAMKGKRDQRPMPEKRVQRTLEVSTRPCSTWGKSKMARRIKNAPAQMAPKETIFIIAGMLLAKACAMPSRPVAAPGDPAENPAKAPTPLPATAKVVCNISKKLGTDKSMPETAMEVTGLLSLVCWGL